MRAIVQSRYGGPEALALTELDRPTPAVDEVLVRVRAAAVNAADWHVMRGDPYIARLMAPQVFGRRGPKRPVRGRDFAGTVEAVGPGATDLPVGAEVYGDLGLADGAFAEYAVVPVSRVARKPENLTFEQAAAVPLSGSTALLGLRDLAKVRPGQSVLINGASGGVGTFAVQIAKALGAEVTGVCSPRNADQLRSLGADHVVDYTREDFTRTEARYDVLFDLVGNRRLRDLRRVVKPGGTSLLSGGGSSTGGSVFGPIGRLIAAQATGRFVPQRLVPMTGEPAIAEHLAELRELIEAGRVRPAVDRTYPLEQAPEAIRYLETEHARAKVVITIAEAPAA
ncbi:NAD(P)-dependent alcohol dehydrogenase [Naasia sp. SYSU D00057]|uniref:NAD(P)-dependent alcohol dehydrogenase n=1 Tax=Naasia sp. SYSU D00057 TaxID=2817380 RepID=UPI001B30ADAC|nr:NAD(P)-dependent alcohol dehydrogenase [Naasia sp. SYSU D00057]